MKIVKIMVILLILVICVVLSLRAFNSNILRNPSLNFLRGIVVLFVPPSDLYDPPLASVLLEGNSVNIRNLHISHKYLGKHAIEILFPHKNNISLQEQSIASSIVCKSNDIVLNKKSSKTDMYYGKHGTGYSLLYYSVFEDMPLDTEFNCQIEVDLTEINENEIYLVVRKMSDL